MKRLLSTFLCLLSMECLGDERAVVAKQNDYYVARLCFAKSDFEDKVIEWSFDAQDSLSLVFATSIVPKEESGWYVIDVAFSDYNRLKYYVTARGAHGSRSITLNDLDVKRLAGDPRKDCSQAYNIDPLVHIGHEYAM